MRGGRCCAICKAVLARMTALLVNSLLMTAKESEGIASGVSLIEVTASLTIISSGEIDSTTAACTLHLLENICLFVIC